MMPGLESRAEESIFLEKVIYVKFFVSGQIFAVLDFFIERACYIF